MKIIIVGAGEVGFNIAGRLASESKQVIVIDIDEKAVNQLGETLDVQTITGSGSSPDILQQAGIQEADIILAVTDSDEVNLVACLAADMLAPGIKKLARVRNAEFGPFHDRLKTDSPHVGAIINPEKEVVDTIRRLMNVPGAVDVGSFINGRVKYVGVRIHPTSPMADTLLADLPGRFGPDRPLIAAIIRNHEVIVPTGNDRIWAGDLVYFVCRTEDLETTLARFGIQTAPVKTALIIGGGRIGERLARTLEADGVKARIIESDLGRCRYLSQHLRHTVILHGDGSDQPLLLEENAGEKDAVICVTNDDETNILVSLLARSMGVDNTIARIEKASYFPLLATIGIEKAVSPRLSAISSILHDVRQGKILSDISIYGEKGEFIEAVAVASSGIIDRPLKKISFPKGALLVCIIKNGRITIPAGDSIIEAGDRVILFAVKQAVKKLEKLLTVKLGFF